MNRMLVRRRLPALCAAFAAMLALTLAAVPAAPGKEGVVALLDRPLPKSASPGATVVLRWTLSFCDGGRLRRFNAGGVFVRLRSATGKRLVDVTAGQGPLGHYAASVTVPRGGISAVRIGLHGTTDIFFPLRARFGCR